jgi:hypothetical protein
MIAAALVTLTFSAGAQQRGRVYYGEDSPTRYDRQRNTNNSRVYYDGYRNVLQMRINWLFPEEETPRRYTIAVRPFQLVNDGLKVDFELELNTVGQWLQFSLAGYYKPQFDPYKYSDDDGFYYDRRKTGWTNWLSDNDEFQKFGGVGIGVAFKSMISNNGWYWNAGINFTFYNVSYKAYGTYEFYEDGMQFWHNELRTVKTQYYKPGFNVNIGKHFALSRNLFLDAYAGLGYERTYKGGVLTDSFGDSMFSFNHDGVYFSGGFRIGWMWPNKQ